MPDPNDSGAKYVSTARYWIYTHWAVGNKRNHVAQWQANEEDQHWLLDQPVYRYLAEAQDRLNELLDQTQGLLIVFFDPGLDLSLKLNQSDEDRASLRNLERYSDLVSQILTAKFARAEGSRVAFFTVRTVGKYIGGLTRRERSKIYRWVLGELGKGAYDTPKVIEAFLRVRLIGSGVPVLRVDWDALINVESERFIGLGVTAGAIQESLEYDEKQQRDVSVRTWMCSVGYERPTHDHYDDYREWSRGFATRIQPALLAKSNICSLIYGDNFGLLKEQISEPEGYDKDLPNQIANQCFMAPLAEKYLGVRFNAARGLWEESASSANGISRLGAHPLHAVISGALLNISASAILDLPPFSNMMRTVMWIDDHLKFELHRALGHFGRRSGESGRIEGVVVNKGRACAESNLAAYTWASYLPTLMLGFVMDAWIRKESATEKDDRPLVKALKEAITTGSFDKRAAMKLEKELREVAIKRIRTVHEAWKELRVEDGTPTLAHAWATSQVEKLVTSALTGVEFNPQSHGAGLIAPNRESISAISDLQPGFQDELRELIWDAVEYIDLTKKWPEMIQTIRSIPQQGVL